MGASPILSPKRRVRCPSCGSERLAVRTERDPIDRLYQTPSDMVRRLFVADMTLYHCYVCRLQFYDVGESARAADQKAAQSAPPADAAPQRAVIAEPGAGHSALIGHTMTIKGRVSSQENILVNGEIQGDLEVPAHQLTIGTGGRLYGDVRAAEVAVMGTLEGDVWAEQKVVLRATATMTGNIRTRSLQIEEGAFFKGKIEMA